MNYGLYISAAGLKAQEARQSVISNNLANAQTTGFKRDLAVMQARANPTFEDPRMFQFRVPALKNQGGGVFAVGDGMDLTQANLEKTPNPTDVALDGKGFFTVGGANGQKLLTRDGRFMMDTQGALITATGGRPVLDADGQPITLDPKYSVHISTSGEITQGDSLAGTNGPKLGLADVSDPRRLIKLGGNVLTVDKPDAMTDISADTRVMQGHLEASGVDPMTEIVNMISGQRAFDANARMISYQDQTMSQLNTIGRVA